MSNKVWKHEVLSEHQKWQLRRFWQSHPIIRILSYIIIFLLIGMIIGKCTTSPRVKEIITEKPVEKIVSVEKIVPQNNIFFLKAIKPYIVGSYGDNFQWSGSKIKTYNGTAVLKLDPENKIGSLIIEFNGAINPEEDALFDGNIKIVMTEFFGEEDWKEGGIARDILLFGDTKKGFEYLPKTKAEIAAWGNAAIYFEDSLVLGNMPAMFMYCDGIRKPDGKISKPNGELYHLDDKDSVEFFDASEKEFHFMMHSDDSDRANFPSHSFFINLYFENVAVKS